MLSLISKYHEKARNVATYILALIAMLLLLLYFMPRETKVGYDYDAGKPWRYNSLIAPFDFPVYRSTDEITELRDSALKQFMPYYEENEKVMRRQIMAFRADFLKGTFSVPSNYLYHIEELLQKVYAAGIIDSNELSQMAKEASPGVRVINGTEALPRKLSEVYSTRTAYEHMMQADTLRYLKEYMARCNLNNYLEPNLLIDSTKTRSAREEVIASVSSASMMVQSGQSVINRGEIVTPQLFQILQSYERELAQRADGNGRNNLVLFGQALFIICVFVSLFSYLRFFRREYLTSPHSILLIVSLVTIFPIITYIMVDHKIFNVYLLPYAMTPIFVRIFLDSRTAFMAMVASAVLASFPLRSNYEFMLIQFVAGMAAIYALKDLTERSQLLRIVFYITLSSIIVMLSYDLAQGITLEEMDTSMYVYLIINGILLLFTYPLLYLIEKMFGFTSSVTLIELSNTNNPMLRRMSKVAQGTFVHSMQVANLAAEVADKVGAKPQLVRTGAIYHDIGKLLNPAFFTENQSGVNPHDELDEEQSARIIISHVTEGLRLAEKYHLPKVIRDFITTHHGRSKARYFYIKWQNNHPNETPNESAFTYPGPNPFTKEQAILMMCDAVEASSRSLKEYSESSITELVDKIVDGQMKEGYFQECPITFRDIADAKRVLVEGLKTIYHTRIAYPELNADSKAAPSTERRTFFFGRRAEK